MNTNNSSFVCPACGSDQVDTHLESSQLAFRFAGNYDFSETVNVCKRCGTEGDFNNLNDTSLFAIKERAQGDAAKNIITSLNDDGYTMAYMERALSIPQRTMMRWKQGSIPAGSLTLLKAVRTCPWMLKMADSDFDPYKCRDIVIEEGFKAAGVMLTSAIPGSTITGYLSGNERFGMIAVVANANPNTSINKVVVKDSTSYQLTGT